MKKDHQSHPEPFAQMLAFPRDLSEMEQQQLAAHVANCAQCQLEEQSFQQMDTLLAAIPWQQPSGRVSAEFYAAVSDKDYGRQSQPFLQKLTPVLGNAVYAAIMLGLIMTLWFSLRTMTQETAVPEIETAVPPTVNAPSQYTLENRLRITQPTPIQQTILSPNGRILITASDDNVQLWHTEDGQLSLTIPIHNPITQLAMTPDGRHLAWLDEAGVVQWWQVADGRFLYETNLGEITHFAVSNSYFATVTPDQTVQIWQTTDGTPHATIDPSLSTISSLAFSQLGSQLVVGTKEGNIQFWSATGEHLRTVSLIDEPITQIAVSIGGSRLALLTAGNKVYYVDTRTNTILASWPSLPAIIHQIRLTPDGRFLFAGLADGTIHGFQLPDGEHIVQFHSPTANDSDLALTQDGFLRANLQDGVVDLWQKPKPEE